MPDQTPRFDARTVATRHFFHYRDYHTATTTTSHKHLTAPPFIMVMHASFLRLMQTGAQLAPPPPPTQRVDFFKSIHENSRTFVVKDIFLHKYLSHPSALELADFNAVAFEDHDGLFDWMKQRLDALGYATKPNGT